MNLRERLLSYPEFIIDDKYFELYVSLIGSNKDTAVQAGVTQSHHIVPCAYFKLNDQSVDNSFCNKVNLSYKDHVLAHCLLCLCAASTQFQYNMFCAINFITGKTLTCVEEVLSLMSQTELEVYQTAYELGRSQCYEYNPMFNDIYKQQHDVKMRSDEVRNKISVTMKRLRSDPTSYYNTEEHHNNLRRMATGRRNFIDTEGNLRHVRPRDFQRRLLEGWLPQRPLTNTEDKIFSNSVCIGKRCRIYNVDGAIRYVSETDLPQFIDAGWSKQPIIKRTYQRHMSQQELHKKLSDSHKGHIPSNKGVPCSESVKQKLRLAITGRRWINNGTIQKQVKLQVALQLVETGEYKYGRLSRKGGDASCETIKNEDKGYACRM